MDYAASYILLGLLAFLTIPGPLLKIFNASEDMLRVGIPALRITARSQIEDGLAHLLAAPGPALLHVAIDARANVWPLVPPNNANSTMLESNPAHRRQETPNAIPA